MGRMLKAPPNTSKRIPLPNHLVEEEKFPSPRSSPRGEGGTICSIGNYFTASLPFGRPPEGERTHPGRAISGWLFAKIGERQSAFGRLIKPMTSNLQMMKAPMKRNHAPSRRQFVRTFAMGSVTTLVGAPWVGTLVATLLVE